jgi:Na+-driven multidrug efflux pump
MVAGVVAVLVNLVINYLLIFGKFGFPEMGVSGAAIGTTISRYVEAGMVIWWTHSHKDNYQYIEGAYKTLLVPKGLTKKIIITGLPLLINEGMWSAGMAAMLQGFSERGLAAVAGMNICNTIINLFSVMFIALGNSVAIIIGKLLGAGKMEEAKDTDRKMIVFSVLVSIVVAVAVYFIAPIFPEFYNATEEASFNKKRSFYPLSPMNITDKLPESNVINGAAKRTIHAFAQPAYQTVPFYK